MKKQNIELISVNDLDMMDFEECRDLYAKYINATKASLLQKFISSRQMINKAEGAMIFTRTNKKILDCTGGYGILNHGHNHPKILSVRKKVLEGRKMEINKNFFSPALAALSHNMSKILDDRLDLSFFPNSGSESIDVAVRLCLLKSESEKTKKKIFLVSDRAFHGKSLLAQALSFSGENSIRLPSSVEIERYRFNDLESLNKFRQRKDIAGICVEPFSASTMTETTFEMLYKLKQLSISVSCPLIYDEVYSGWYKTGSLFNFLKYKNTVWPDILCYGKALGGGKSSISGISYSSKVFSKILNTNKHANFLSSTYYGFYEETVTAIEAINILFEENAEKKSNQINSQMIEINKDIKNLGSLYYLKGAGMLWGLFFEKNLIPNFLNKFNNLLAKTIISDKNLSNKVIAAAIVSHLYREHNILAGVSFGFNTHIIISLGIMHTDDDINKIREAIIGLSKSNFSNMIFKFITENFKNI